MCAPPLLGVRNGRSRATTTVTNGRVKRIRDDPWITVAPRFQTDGVTGSPEGAQPASGSGGE